MAAITPFLEQQDDPAETEATEEEFAIPADVSAAQQGTLYDPRGASVVGNLQGVGAPSPDDVFAIGELTAEVLDQTHAELLNTAWIRAAVEQSLIGRNYRVQARDLAGGNPKKVFIVLDGPIVEGWEEGETVAAWSPAASPNAQQFQVLSWTSKMGAPSFSLPAGPLEAGGSCPGAAAGQSIVPLNKLRKSARLVYERLGKPVRLQQAICQYCYAEGGQYSTGQVQFAQVLRYVWTRQATQDAGLRAAWLDAMSWAIENANYRNDGGRFGKIDYPAERHPGRFFRIHDSGDFFSKQYLAMWKELANRFPDITFWAPTRAWATSWGVQAVNEINADARNLVIRPSAYHINEAPPRNLGPGWAQGSTAFHVSLKDEGAARGEYNWDCQTYAVDDEKHTCRHAVAPDGQVGCRACWLYGDELEVNYTLH